MSDVTQAETRPSFFVAMREHPASVGETYFGHMRFALRFSGLLFAAGGAALVHAVLPALFETTASQMIRRMYAMIEQRH
ncbi:DUF6356 family protein [Litoreibacter janthinus]|uniref:Capsule biosynthesis protein n=1 Tax=Litoreibacter janthinus TaxID=670154 RepID=A0A1I6GLM5_9RHOB|nr:DUF6356 family protein [Litoreibacter janthinus]SFR43103.1 hypothetical protein SAMN04488002_1676 [Litoreibacter janthinus]